MHYHTSTLAQLSANARSAACLTRMHSRNASVLTPQDRQHRRRTQNKMAQRRHREKRRKALAHFNTDSGARITANDRSELLCSVPSSDRKLSSAQHCVYHNSSTMGENDGLVTQNLPLQSSYVAQHDAIAACLSFEGDSQSMGAELNPAFCSINQAPTHEESRREAPTGHTDTLEAPETPVTRLQLARSTTSSSSSYLELVGPPSLQHQECFCIPRTMNDTYTVTHSLALATSYFELAGTSPCQHRIYSCCLRTTHGADTRAQSLTPQSHAVAERYKNNTGVSLARDGRVSGEASVPTISFRDTLTKIGVLTSLISSDEDLKTLLHRLQLIPLPLKDSEFPLDKFLRGDINWTLLGANMLPTIEQWNRAHRLFIDICLPWPAVRSRLLLHSVSFPICETEFALDILLSVLSPEDRFSSFHVHGDHIFDPDAWEVSDRMLTTWWGIFDEAVLKSTNVWRRKRGLPDFSFLQLRDGRNHFEHVGLGTGSLHRVFQSASELLATSN